MIDVAVYNKEGKEVETLQVDEAQFGGEVNYDLLKQAIVMYRANKRMGTAATKSRGMVAGSTRKLFRQKGTGNARVGNSRTHKRVGGGVAFAKVARDFGKRMPKKQKKHAMKNAVLQKLLDKKVGLIDELVMEAPKTKDFSSILNNLEIDRGCLVMLAEANDVIYKSARNITRVSVLPVDCINAGDVCNCNKILFTKDAFMALTSQSQPSDN